MDEEALEDYISYETPIGQILLQITKLTKKPKHNDDLSKTLDVFLDQLHQADEYLANGISFKNFGLSGMVLQKAAEIFSKKVDLLWDDLMQYRKRQFAYMEEDQKLREIKKMDEIRGRIQKTTKALNQMAQKSPQLAYQQQMGAVDHAVDEELEDNWIESYEIDNKRRIPETNVEFANLKPPVKYIGTPDPLEACSDAEIYNEERDETYQYKNIYGCGNLMKYLTDTELYNSDELYYDLVKEFDYLNDYLLENGISAGVAREEYAEDFEKYSRNRFEDVVVVEQTPEVKESFVMLEKLPDEIVTEKMRRMSTKTNENIENLTDSGFFDEHTEVESIHDDSMEDSVEDSAVDSSSNLKIPPEFQERRLSVVLTDEKLHLTRKRKVFYTEEQIEEEKTTPKRKQRKFNVKKLCTGVTANLHSWESFHSENYGSENGEGAVLPYVEPVQTPIQEEDSVQEDDGIQEDDPVQENDPIAEDDRIVNDDTTEIISEEDKIVTNSEEEQTESQESEKNSYEELRKIHHDSEGVKEWIKKGKQIMRNANNHDFDIHTYESDIINRLDTNESRFFKDIVQGKNRTEFVRYAVSSLHLAVTENIEFSGIVPGNYSNDSLKLKLLNKYRHHDGITKFNAPSKQILRDRFKRLQESHSNNTSKCSKSVDDVSTEASFRDNFDPECSTSGLQRQSTPIRSPQPKRIRLIVKNVTHS